MLNTLICAAGGANTGFGQCVLDLGNIKGVFIVPADREFTPAETASAATMLAALTEGISLPPSERIYPIPGFEALTNNSEAPTKATLGYGRPVIVREGLYDLTFQFVDGALCLSKALRKFNKVKVSLLFYDSNGLLLGWKVGANLKGIPMQLFYALPIAFNDGSNPTVYSLELAMEPTYVNDAPGFVQMQLTDLLGLQGLMDVALTEAPGSDGPVYILRGTTGCDGTNMYDTYADELNDTDAWLAFDDQGGEIAITSVVLSPELKAWRVTTAEAAFYVTLNTPEVLETLGVAGYEGLKLYPTNEIVS